MIYFDHNATTRPCEEAVAAMMAALQTGWANPSSTHAPGQQARRLLVDARARAADFLDCQPAELIFTSGATEANHMALLGVGKGKRLVLSAVEHAGHMALAKRLQAEGLAVDFIPVDAQGRLNMDAAKALIRDDVALVSVMAANNETGVLMPVKALAELAHAAGAWLHVDATQMLGKALLSFKALGADLMSVSAHKIGGPKGVGALAIKKGLALDALFSGSQERKRRGGTENLPGIAGFAAACDKAASSLVADIERMKALRERLERGLLMASSQVRINGFQAERLPTTASVRFGELDAEQVLGRLERAGIVASSGAACSAGGTEPSHVLIAMGQNRAQAKAGIRFSFGPGTTEAEIDALIAAVRQHIVPLLTEHQTTGVPA
jgi:cysteine desulfurase